MTANAQSWPNKPVRLIIPYAAGGPTDVMARKLGVRLSTELGQPVVIENKPGAGGVIGVDAVVKANADGYTLGLIAPGPVAGMPALTKVPYSNADIDYITLVSRSTSVIATSSQSPFENLNALINAAKKAPGTLNYGSAGNGTSPHIGGEMLKQEAGIDVRHIPYKGSGPTVPAVLSGEIHYTLIDLVGAIPLANEGKLRILATASAKRADQIPNIPTTVELGLPNVIMDTNYGIIGPKGIPAATRQKIIAAMHRTVKSEDVLSYFAQQGIEPLSSTSAEYRDLMKSELDRWTKVIVKGDLKLD